MKIDNDMQKMLNDVKELFKHAYENETSTDMERFYLAARYYELGIKTEKYNLLIDIHESLADISTEVGCIQELLTEMD